MPLYLSRRKSGIWRVRGTHHGKSYDHSTRTRDKVEAEAVREALERQTFETEVLGKRPAYSFASAAIDYIKGGGEKRYLEPIIRHFGMRDVANLRQSDLDNAARALYPDAKPSTINRQVHTPFIAIMKLAADNDHCTARRWRRPKQPQGRTDWRTPDEMEAILQALQPRARAMVTFMLGCFPRASETIELLRRDISPGATRVTFWETKGGYPRSVDLPVRAQEAVREALSWPGGPDDPLWRSDKTGQPWHAYDAVNAALKRACKDSKSKALSCHVLRHTGATWRYSMTKDLTALKRDGGWKSLTMVERYVHAGSDDLAAAAKSLNWAIDGQSGPEHTKKVNRI